MRISTRLPMAGALMILALTVPNALAQEPADTARPAWLDPVASTSEVLPQALHSLLLDLTRMENGRLIAVGERGHVLLSDDEGRQWRQVTVPSRVNLTAVASAGDNVVAVGHEGVVLHSPDAGESWRRVREEPYSIDNQFSPSNGAPVLDVLFLDARRVLAIGAYNLMLASDDGGASWHEAPMNLLTGDSSDEEASEDDWNDEDEDENATAASETFMLSGDDLLLDEDTDPHLNAIARSADGALFIVGERGTLYRSHDEGESWQRLPLDYGGSMYGILSPAAGHVLVFGLRGQVFESRDGGDGWNRLDSGVLTTLFDGSIGAGGRVVLVGAEGSVIEHKAGSGRFTHRTHTMDDGQTPTLAAIVHMQDGRILLAGERGITGMETN